MNAPRLCLAVAACLALISFTAHAQGTDERKPRAKMLDHIVAVVGDDTITRAELRHEMKLAVSDFLARKQQAPPPDELRALVIEEMISDKLQQQEAKRFGIQVDELALDRSMQQLADRNNMSLEELRRTAEKDGVSYADLRDRVRKKVIRQRLVQQAVIGNIEVSEKEIDEEIKKLGLDAHHEYRFVRITGASPENARALNQVRVALSDYDDLTAARIKRLLKRRAQKDGKQPPWRVRVLDWRTTDRLPRALRNQLSDITLGAFSRVIKTKRDARLYFLLDTRAELPDGEVGGEGHVMYKARHILIRTNVIDSPERVKRRLERLKRDIENGKYTFAELARRYSEDPISGFKGGALGWVSPETLVPEFAKQLAQAPIGKVVGPFSTSYGEHLLEVLDTRAQSDNIQAVRNRIEADIRRRKANGEIRQWQIDLRNRYYVKVRSRARRGDAS